MSPTSGPRTVAAQARDILDRHPDLELMFVQQRNTGTVHGLVPVDPDVPPEYVRFGFVRVVDWLGWLSDRRRALCGYRSHVSFVAGEDHDQYVSVFPDQRLCGGCLRSLGPHQARAFEHPQTYTRPLSDQRVLSRVIDIPIPDGDPPVTAISATTASITTTITAAATVSGDADRQVARRH